MHQYVKNFWYVQLSFSKDQIAIISISSHAVFLTFYPAIINAQTSLLTIFCKLHFNSEAHNLIIHLNHFIFIETCGPLIKASLLNTATIPKGNQTPNNNF
jgi:hypothetical protein